MNFPNSRSAPIASAIMRGGSDMCGALSVFTEEGVCHVFNHGARVMRVSRKTRFKEEALSPEWDIEISLGGWGDFNSTRQNINSILARLGTRFRIGVKDSVCYLYYVMDERTRETDGRMAVIRAMPVNQFVELPDDLPAEYQIVKSPKLNRANNGTEQEQEDEDQARS